MQLGSNASIDIFYDHWMLDLPITWKPTFVNIQFTFPAQTVSYLIHEGIWWLNLLYQVFDPTLAHTISAIPLSMAATLEDDRWAWVTFANSKVSPKADSAAEQPSSSRGQICMVLSLVPPHHPKSKSLPLETHPLYPPYQRLSHPATHHTIWGLPPLLAFP